MRNLSRLLLRAALAAAIAAATTAGLSLAGCNGERQAVPDPAKPPKPKIVPARD